MEYSIEYKKGIVKNIPIQNPIKPTSEARKATISKAKISKGCFKISWMLDFMASIAFKFPKTINGTVKKVSKVIANEVNSPNAGIPVYSMSMESPELMNVIINVAPTMFVKNGGL